MNTEHDTPASRHTPGPWLFDESNGVFSDEHGTPLGQVFDNADHWKDPIGDETSMYNGRLIVTAPALALRVKALEAALASVIPYLQASKDYCAHHFDQENEAKFERAIAAARAAMGGQG